MRTVTILLLAAAAAFGQTNPPPGPILTAVDAFLPPPSPGGPPIGPGGPAVTAGVGGAGGILLHLTGLNFQGAGDIPGSTVQWIVGSSTTELTPPYGAVDYTGTLLVVPVPASLIAQPGSVLVKVVNPDGTASVGLPFTINAFPAAGALPAGTVGVGYSQPMITGGTGPFTVSVTQGSPPLSQTGLTASQPVPTVSGTPAAAGTFNFSAVITDAWGQGITPNYSVTIYNPLVLVTATLPNGTVNSAYPATNLQATGGQSPYGWSVVSGSLPAGLSLDPASGAITGTPATAGVSTFTVQVADFGSRAANRQFSITVLPPPIAITSTSPLPAAIAGVSYSYQFTATGGVSPAWAQISQPPIPGLTLSSAGVLSGIPTTPGTYTIGVRVTAGGPAAQVSASGSFTLVVGQTNLAVTAAVLPAGTVGSAYTAPPLSATGATAPYTWSIAGGALPGGLFLNSSTGAISGSPQSAGTANFTVQVADSSGQTATRPFSIRVDPALVLVTATLPNATLNTAYPASLQATGGLAPHGWSITSGALPSGLGLNPASGAITGAPTVVGASTFTAQVSDAAGRTASRQFFIAVLPPPINITSTSPLPPATAGAGYSYQFTATGGVPPLSWALTSETPVPAGLTLSPTGVLGGIPTTPGNYNIFVLASAGAQGAQVSAGGFFAMVVGQTNLAITSLLFPVGTVGSPYSAQFTATGATPPYTWTIVGGSLPLGLSLNASTGAISGTPMKDGTGGFTVQVADSSGQRVSRLVGIDIVPRVPPLAIVTEALPKGMVDQPYGAGVSATGGEPPYSWAISGLPPGLNAGSGGGINGTPTTPGTFSVGATVTDSGGRTASKSYSVVIEPPPLVITTLSPLGEAALNAAYSATFAASGGIKPYSWALNGGSLPPGMSFAAGGVLSGKPVAEGTFDFSVLVSDSNQKSTSKGFRIVVRSEQLLITTGSPLSKGNVGQPYSAGFAARGGTQPYRWTGSGIPPGLTLDAAGNLGGTPTAVGSTTISVEVADSTGAKASKSFELTILAELLRITTSAAADGVMGAPYSQSFAATGGTPPYRWAIVAGYAGAGLAMSAGGELSGRPLDLGSATFIVQATDSEGATASRQFRMNVAAPPIKIPTTDPPGGGSVGGPYSHTVSVDGAVGPVTWTATGLPPGITLGPDGTLSGTPTTPGTYPVTVTATDSAGRTTTETFVIVVGMPPLPTAAFAGLPDASDPGRQFTLQLGLGGTYPMGVTGRLTLTFAPDGGGAGDPAVQFSTGGTTATFTIPAGANLAAFTVPNLGIQTGTVAGVVTVTATFSAGGQDVTPSPGPTQTIRINRTPPVITDVRITRTATGFDVQITGYSSTREVRQAVFRFNAVSGGGLQTTDQTVTVDTVFTRWYQDPGAQPFGSRFTFVQQFTLQGNAAAIASVQVTLTNSVGSSNAVTANMP